MTLPDRVHLIAEFFITELIENLFGKFNCFNSSVSFTYLMGNPKALPSLRKIINAVALKINPTPAKIVSIMSRINEPEYLQGNSDTLYLYLK